MIRTAAFALVLLASAAEAQTPRLTFRDAYLPGQGGAVPDTAAMQRAALSDGSAVYLGETLLELGVGSVVSASLAFDAFTDAPEITLAMAPAAGETFARITATRIGRPLAVVLDGRVLTAPTIMGEIPNGRVQITGQFTRSEAEAIASAIRESTQAADPRAALIRDLRASVDLSRPDSAALAMRRSAAASDWLTVARILHPDVLRVLRAESGDELVLQDGRVRASASGLPFPPAPGREASPSASEPGLWISVRDVIGTDAPGERLEDFSDEQVGALLFAAFGGPRGSNPDLRLVGTVEAGPDVAYVVLSPATPTAFGDAGISEAVVVEVRRVDGQWRVLLPASGW